MLREMKKPNAISAAKWTSPSCAVPTVVTRHCTSSTAASVARAPVTESTATKAAKRSRAASRAAIRRKSAAMASPAAKAVRIAHGASAGPGRATNPSPPSRSSFVISPTLTSARKRQDAVPR